MRRHWPFETTLIDLRPLLLREKKRLSRERVREFESVWLHPDAESNQPAARRISRGRSLESDPMSADDLTTAWNEK